jgi:hypothetical protein
MIYNVKIAEAQKVTKSLIQNIEVCPHITPSKHKTKGEEQRLLRKLILLSSILLSLSLTFGSMEGKINPEVRLKECIALGDSYSRHIISTNKSI